MIFVFHNYADLTHTSLAVDAEKPRYFSLVILLGAKSLSLEKSAVVFGLEMINCSDFMVFKGRISQNFVSATTIRAHEYSAVEAETFGAVFPAVPAIDLPAISVYAYIENTKQPVLQKTRW